MKFLIPAESDRTKAEELYNLIREIAKDATGWEIADHRIFSLDLYDKGRPCHLEVGKPAPMNGELVIAIFDSNAFLVCTRNRGVAKGEPIMLGKHEPFSVQEFET
jgi:hypothetical protein